MELTGWNDIPDCDSAEFRFEDGPKWLRALALTPFFERYAYPIAINKGLGILWCETVIPVGLAELSAAGWKVKMREKTNRERFIEGSMAALSTQGRHLRRWHFSFTRLGRQRSTRRSVHRANGTIRHMKKKTFPAGW